MKKTRKMMMSALATIMVLGCAACGSSSGTDTSSDKTETGTTEQTTTTDNNTSAGNEIVEVSGEFDAVPEDYPWIAADDFQTAFDEFYEKSNASDATSMTYDDIAAIFGAPGAYYADKDYNDGEYKYYKWFSDDEKDVLITFKGDGMTYFAWTSSTVKPSN